MKTIFPLLAAVVLLAPTGSGPLLRAADATIATSQKLLAEHQDAIVRVTAQLKTESSGRPISGSRGTIYYGGSQPGQKVSGFGTVIDTNGLVVTALSTLDSGREARSAGGDTGYELKELKLILADGTEIPADLVLKDPDFDLAFLRPKAGTREARNVVFKPLDLRHHRSLKTAEDLICLSRTEETLNYQPMIQRGHIQATVSRPRELIKASNAVLGCPAFSEDGYVIGLGVNFFMKGRSSQVVMPAADVLEIAELLWKPKSAPDKSTSR